MAVLAYQGEAEVLQRVQDILQGNLSTVITAYNLLWADTDLEAPASSDIQIGPEYNTSGDPVVAIEWRNAEQLRFLSGRMNVAMDVSILLAFQDNVDVGSIAVRQARYARVLWQALWSGRLSVAAQTGVPVDMISDFEYVNSVPLNMQDARPEIAGWAVELNVRVLAHFVLPSVGA